MTDDGAQPEAPAYATTAATIEVRPARDKLTSILRVIAIAAVVAYALVLAPILAPALPSVSIGFGPLDPPSTNPLTAAVTILAIAVVLAAFYTLAFRRMRLVLTPESITLTRLIGPATVIPRQPGQSLVVALRLPDVRGFLIGHTGRIVLFDPTGAPLLRLRTDFWDVIALGRFTRAFGDQRILVREDLTGHELQERYPGTMSFVSRHKIALVLSALLVLVAVVVGADALSGAFATRE